MERGLVGQPTNLGVGLPPLSNGLLSMNMGTLRLRTGITPTLSLRQDRA